MTQFDTHMHSLYSFDSKMTLEEMRSSALNHNLSGIVITDHVELEDKLLALLSGYKKESERSKQIKSLSSLKLKILNGIEISEPYLRMREMPLIHQLPVDVILGSVHEIIRSQVEERDINQAYNDYYEKNLKAVATGNFDVLAHLDYIKRYYPDYEYQDKEHIIDTILKLLIQKDIVLEMNTSSKRRCGHELFPSIEILEKYKSFGGEKVTIGSDAHCPEEIGDRIETGYEIAKELKLTPGYFEKRKWKTIL